MEIHDEYIPEDEFAAFLDQMPQVCVELVVETEDGVLLARRTTKPRVWFWPGSRLYKGERLRDAAHRVANEELGIEVTLHGQLGAQAHHWNADETSVGVSRHTVNIVFHASPASDGFEIELNDQHAEYRFVSAAEPDCHEYVQNYFDTFGLPRGTQS